jgi:hypothetical protein
MLPNLFTALLSLHLLVQFCSVNSSGFRNFFDPKEKFVLDYGSPDTERNPGFISGMVKPGALADLMRVEKDSFIQWLLYRLENTVVPKTKNRIKPFYVIVI